jgi:hypothetical protein
VQVNGYGAGGLMLKKLFSLLLIFSFTAIAVAPAYGKESDDQDKAARKTKQKISQLGLNAPVIVKIADGRELNGEIAEIDDDKFVLLTGKNYDRIVIKYREVKQVKYIGSTGGANLLPGFLIAGAAILLIKLLR